MRAVSGAQAAVHNGQYSLQHGSAPILSYKSKWRVVYNAQCELRIEGCTSTMSAPGLLKSMHTDNDDDNYL